MPVAPSKITYSVLAGSLLVFAIVSTGIASNLLIRFTDDFPSSKIGSLTRLAEFGSVWLLFFSVIFFFGTFTAAGWASPFIGSVVFFIGFLATIVASGALSQRDRLFGFNSGPDAAMAGVSKNLKALEAFLWLDVFASLALTIYLFYKNAQSESSVQEKKAGEA